MTFIGSDRTASPILHVTSMVFLATFFVVVAVAFLFHIEIVSRGVGKVVPSLSAQVIASQFPGQVKAILVENGRSVTKGQMLIKLDSTKVQSELTAIAQEMRRLNMEKSRIHMTVAAIDDPENRSYQIARDAYVRLYPRENSIYFRAQQKLLAYDVKKFLRAKAQIDREKITNNKTQDVIRANIMRLQSLLTIQRDRLQTMHFLLQKHAVSRFSYLDTLEKYTDLQRQKNIQVQQLNVKISQFNALNIKQFNMVASLKSQYFRHKSEIIAKVRDLRQRYIVAQRRVASASLRSPVNGIVDQLTVHTIGAVVQSYQPLMHIIPKGDILKIKAVFPNRDSGFLKVGQRANIKFDAFPSGRFGYLKGKVSYVSADAVKINALSWGFVCQIMPSKPYLQTPSARYKYRPGMTVTVDVITGKRSLISYFFAPIVKTLQDSLGER